MAPPTLLSIRYYNQFLDPSLFVDKGWRGRFILFLNWVRYWVETLVQYQVLLSGLAKAEVGPQERSQVVSQFFQDVRAERAVHSPSSSSSPSSIYSSNRRVRYMMSREDREVVDYGEDEQSSRLVEVQKGRPITDLIQEKIRPRKQGRYLDSDKVVEGFEPVISAEKE